MFTHTKGLVLLWTGSFYVTGNSGEFSVAQKARTCQGCAQGRLPVYLQGLGSSGVVFKAGMRYERDKRIQERSGKTMYDELTKNDIKKMEEEIEYRKLVVRKEAIEAVKEARAQGDLSENFEYYAAKKDKNKNESRIRYLERMIRTAKVVSDESKDDEVGLYNTVDVYFEDDDETETYKIVTTIRGNSLKGLISSESPLGRALLGHKVGDRVHVQVNDRAGYDVIIKRLEKTVDDGSDAIRSF